ncbi:MAG: hypothetical protein J7K31_02540 [Candidatus Aenigmarchaeota archaeon]|nr:hypothetical protein [Candidatus Aenigmarchaeota archaeon]
MNDVLRGIIFIISGLLFLSVSVFAIPTVNTTSEVNITVTVGTVTQIDFTPDSLSWSNLNPGEIGSEKDLFIENIGSTNITYLWLNTTHPTSRPFGSGLTSSYDAGNFVVLKRETNASWAYFYVNRHEWNESSTLPFASFDSGWKYGRFRTANFSTGSYHEFIWTVNPGANGLCNDTDANAAKGDVRIAKTPHNSSSTGTTDFTSTGSDYTYYNMSNAGGNYTDWGLAEVTIEGYKYCMAIASTCDHAIFYKYNLDVPGEEGGCSYQDLLADGTTKFNPGDTMVLNVRVVVPYGTPHGSITGKLTLVAAGVE